MDQLRRAAISFPMLGENFSVCPPASFQLLGRTVYLYGIIIAVGFLLAILYNARRNCKLFGVAKDDLYDALIAAVPLGIIGARLYYCLSFKDASGANPYLQDPVSILRIWEGGLAIYGGVIGGALGMLLTAWRKKISLGALLDMGGMGLLIGQAIGRWGNFTNREAFGWSENVDTLFCRMGLTVPGYQTFYVHPTFLYESLWNVIGFLALHFWTKKHRRRFDGQIFVLYLAWYGLGRMLIEGLRTDSLWLVPGKIRISQLLAAVTFVIAVALLLVFGRKKDRVLYAERAPKEDPLPAEAEKGEDVEEETDDAEEAPAEEAETGDEAAEETEAAPEGALEEVDETENTAADTAEDTSNKTKEE